MQYIDAFNSLSSTMNKIKTKINLPFILKREDYSNGHDLPHNVNKKQSARWLV